jgi:hypothetical protein
MACNRVSYRPAPCGRYGKTCITARSSHRKLCSIPAVRKTASATNARGEAEPPAAQHPELQATTGQRELTRRKATFSAFANRGSPTAPTLNLDHGETAAESTLNTLPGARMIF